MGLITDLTLSTSGTAQYQDIFPFVKRGARTAPYIPEEAKIVVYLFSLSWVCENVFSDKVDGRATMATGTELFCFHLFPSGGMKSNPGGISGRWANVRFLFCVSTEVICHFLGGCSSLHTYIYLYSSVVGRMKTRWSICRTFCISLRLFLYNLFYSGVAVGGIM